MTIKDEIKNLKLNNIENYELYYNGTKLKYSRYKEVLDYKSDAYILQVLNSKNIINIVYKYNNEERGN